MARAGFEDASSLYLTPGYRAPAIVCSLAEKVRIARINKGRADQLLEKKVLTEQQQEYDRSINQYVNQAAAEAEAMEAENQAKRREANVQARLMLEEQIVERQVRRMR